jgi:hypothetical protein
VAEDLVERRTDVARPLVAPPSASAPRHRSRFLLAYAALGAVVACSVAAFVVLAHHPAAEEAAAWSPWRPTGDGSEYATEIASYVSGKYKLPSGNPIVNVIAGPPQVQNVDIRWVTIRGSSEVASTDDAVMYVLCGGGNRCSIREGKPTAARLRALKREALELALYTFTYVDGVDSVIELLPPTPKGQSSGALFFRKRDLGAELDRPLQATLARPGSVKPARVDPSEVLTVERLTTPYLFTYQFQQAQDGSAVLVLARPPTG